ncbi:hypothetical protein FOCG_05867 [Fusarium oxysporum f. sp. radicis-lycopersici 26381]|uniref:Uncharacterized protein n=3 Tax=Fusarium oxysporum TaxID=5507 RepID=A0A2H3TLR2_FUSOX|nr:hypothetical protein FOZG_11531 [Fusarium oxysporum Fo47]EWZ96351.1 hypothetical protein FOWG_03754 [Fusarium oxysporum f. sp. lycopersici MN25]EXL55191.1 hypothetical protein FOCG_05867 [Fusarium oxysporum f. sp. radicis-lycopersici 26381]EXM27274.1 hypothetical protein FOTG_06613 [Fusarium oxysporum f. sp. vasinfectum 25433]KAJ4277673.1 hypothetical protein NW764_007712 [Fusarium oxysporum]
MARLNEGRLHLPNWATAIASESSTPYFTDFAIGRTARQASRHSVPGSLCFPHVINLSDTEFDRQKRASTHIGPQINDGVARASEISKLP